MTTITNMHVVPSQLDHSASTLVVAGVGLIGGSIARAARSRGIFQKVVGVGRNQKRLDAAVQAGVIDEWALDLAEASASANLVVICTPVDRIAQDVVTAHSRLPENGFITDAGSVKERLVNEVNSKLGTGHRFVGAHPLAGSEKCGYEHANPELYAGATVVVTPEKTTPVEAVNQVSQFWRELGSQVEFLSPAEHDLILARTSHMPHLVSSALAGAVPLQDLPWAATGFADTTRIAAGDPKLWTSIFLENDQATLQAAEQFLASFQTLVAALKTRQPEKLKHLLDVAKQHRDKWQSLNES